MSNLKRLTRYETSRTPYITVKAQCPSCHGTGVYVGYAEPEGEAVVCTRCTGKGWINLYYAEFNGRRRHPGVETVNYGPSYFVRPIIPGNAKDTFDEQMTYSEFEANFPVDP
jgi:hypothetical protein